MTARGPQLLVDADAEKLFLGFCMADPSWLAHPKVTPALFAAHGDAFRALRAAHQAGQLGGDLSTASAALDAAGIPHPKTFAAEAMLAAEAKMPKPVLALLLTTATARTTDQLAEAVKRTMADARTADQAETRETLATLGAKVADLGLNGDRPKPWTGVSTVPLEEVEWLWTGWIPFRKLTVLDGDPGLGKTALAMDVAARITTQQPLPGDPLAPLKPLGVVIINAEDGIGDTLRPRLEAAGADLDRILAFDLDRIPTLPDGLPTVRDAIRACNAALLIIDPVMAVLSAATDAYRDQDVRRVLGPLAALAAELNVAVLLVRHLTKQPGPKALYRGGGSIAFGGVARSVLLVAPDPDEPETRILAPVKSNLGPPPGALRFRLTTTAHNRLRVDWLGASTLHADQLVAPPPKDQDAPHAVADAMTVLTDLLRHGPLAVELAMKEKRRLGISNYAWRAAYGRLGVRLLRPLFGGACSYALPTEPPAPEPPH